MNLVRRPLDERSVWSGACFLHSEDRNVEPSWTDVARCGARSDLLCGLFRSGDAAAQDTDTTVLRIDLPTGRSYPISTAVQHHPGVRGQSGCGRRGRDGLARCGDQRSRTRRI